MTLATKAFAAIVLALVVAGGISWAVQRHEEGKGSKNEAQSQQFQGAANADASHAQAIPDHTAELAQAAKDLVGARAEVERLRGLVAAQRRQRVPDPALPDPPKPESVEPDHRDELLAADAILIAKQDADIQKLTLALADKTRQADFYQSAFENERKATAAQEAATKAWKEAVTASRWRGRVEGFVAGAALGYVGGRLK